MWVDYLSSDLFILAEADGGIFSPLFHFKSDIKHPIARFLGNDEVIVIDTRIAGQAPNAYVFGYDGQQRRAFHVGDGVEDVVVVGDKIVVSYFDEGVFGSNELSRQGVSVFDFNGKFLRGYNENAGGEIADCYAVSRFDNSSILFFPYTEFNLTLWNVETGEVKKWKTPETLHGSHALSFFQDKILFGGPYNEKSSIFSFDRETGKAEKIGEFSGDIRSGSHGYFSILNNQEATVVKLKSSFRSPERPNQFHGDDRISPG